MTNTAQLSQKVYLSIETKHGTVQIEIQILLNFWTINGMEIKNYLFLVYITAS